MALTPEQLKVSLTSLTPSDVKKAVPKKVKPLIEPSTTTPTTDIMPQVTSVQPIPVKQNQLSPSLDVQAGIQPDRDYVALATPQEKKALIDMVRAGGDPARARIGLQKTIDRRLTQENNARGQEPKKYVMTPEMFQEEQNKGLKDIAGGLISSATSLGESVTGLLDKPAQALARAIAPSQGVSQEQVTSNIQSVQEREKTPIGARITGGDAESLGYKGGKLVGDIAQTAIVGGLASKIPVVAGAVSKLGAMGNAGKIAVGALEGAGGQAVYSGIADKRLPTSGELALGAGVGGAIPALGVAYQGAKKVLPKIEGSIRSSAGESVSQALAPTGKKMKQLTERITPTFLQKGMRGSKESLLATAKEGVENFGQQIDNAIEGGILDNVKIPRSQVDDVLATAKEATMVGGKVVNTVENKVISEVQDMISQFPEAIGGKEARAVKSILDRIVYATKGGIGAEDLTYKNTIYKSVADTLRSELSKASPDLAKLNKEFSFYKNLSDILETTITRQKPQSGMLRKGASMIFAGGAQGGPLDRIMSYIGSKVFLDATSSSTRNTISAVLKNKLANAISIGDTTAINAIAKEINKTNYESKGLKGLPVIETKTPIIPTVAPKKPVVPKKTVTMDMNVEKTPVPVAPKPNNTLVDIAKTIDDEIGGYNSFTTRGENKNSGLIANKIIELIPEDKLKTFFTQNGIKTRADFENYLVKRNRVIRPQVNKTKIVEKKQAEKDFFDNVTLPQIKEKVAQANSKLEPVPTTNTTTQKKQSVLPKPQEKQAVLDGKKQPVTIPKKETPPVIETKTLVQPKTPVQPKAKVTTPEVSYTKSTEGKQLADGKPIKEDSNTYRMLERAEQRKIEAKKAKELQPPLIETPVAPEKQFVKSKDITNEDIGYKKKPMTDMQIKTLLNKDEYIKKLQDRNKNYINKYGLEKFNGEAENSYIKHVKKYISEGYDVPQSIIDISPEFKKGLDARARYEKGLYTSFSNKDVRIDKKITEEIGAGVKRQDGKQITTEQIQQITKGVKDFGDTLGIDIKKLSQDLDVVYVHLNGKNPFLKKNTAGLYRKRGENISISVGGKETVSEVVNGKKITEDIDTTMQHELGHALDFMKDNRLFDNINDFRSKNSIPYAERPRNTYNPVTRMKDYYAKTEEVTARLVEQYVSIKKGLTSYYEKPGYWKKEKFDTFIPYIENAIKENFGDYALNK